MFSYLKRKIVKDEIRNVDFKLQRAFSSVDNDMKRLENWLKHLYQRHSELERSHTAEKEIKRRELENASRWISYLHSHILELRNITGGLNERMRVLTKRQEENENKLRRLEEEISELKTEKNTGSEVQYRTEPEPSTEPEKNRKRGPEEQSRSYAFTRTIMEKIEPNRKNFVIREIIREIETTQPTTKELERQIVEKENLCGRTTFYAYLRELRRRGVLETATIGAKRVLVVKKKKMQAQ